VPFLSVVVACRNDDHGGDMLRRMQVSLGALVEQLERHGVDAELLLVEWNPPPGRPLASDRVRWPERTRHVSVWRCLVAPEIHRRFAHHECLPIHGAVAWNCGIRRARGRFVLPGTIDAVYSSELVCWLASGELEKDVLYRIDRSDVDRRVLDCRTLDELLEASERSVIRELRRRRLWDRYPGLPPLHFLTSGDFQLMARERFHDLRGYAERDLASAHCDTLLCFQAHASGVREVVLQPPLRLYHIDHAGGFSERVRRRAPRGWQWLEKLPLSPRTRNRMIAVAGRILGLRVRSEVRGVPALDWLEAVEICREMVSGRRSPVLNGPEWGLGEERLPEEVLLRADWDGPRSA
jgi:hypothetical protein